MRRRTTFTGQSDEDLDREIGQLRKELDLFRRSHEGRTKDDAHRAVDAKLQELQAEMEAQLERAAGNLKAMPVMPTAGIRGSFLELVASFTASTDDRFRKSVHAAVDASELYSPLSGAEVAKEIGRLEQEIQQRQAELERRAADREVAAARARLAEAEAKLTGTAGAS